MYIDALVFIYVSISLFIFVRGLGILGCFGVDFGGGGRQFLYANSVVFGQFGPFWTFERLIWNVSIV